MLRIRLMRAERSVLEIVSMQQCASLVAFTNQLRNNEEEREAILTRTAGALSPEEADELNRVIEEGCEKIDESDW